MIFKFSVKSKKIEMDFQSQGLYQRLSTKTDTTNTMTTTAMTLTELRMKNNTPSRFLKQDDIELIVSLFENASSHAEFEAELRKKFEKKCDICELERDLETGECDCRIVECAACGEKHPKYELNLVEGVFGLRCDECDPTQHTSCYECGECLDDPSSHIFCFAKEGEEDRTLCCECGQDLHKEYKSEGWTRDDESMLGSDDEEDEDEDEEEEEEDSEEEEDEDCRGYKGCFNKLTTKEERGAKMCESCTNIWKGFEKDGVACGLRSDLGEAIYAARNAELEDLIISVAAKLQQKGFDAGKHDRPWCEEAEKQHRAFFPFTPFEAKKEIYEKFCEDLKKLEDEEKEDSDDDEDRYVCGVCGKTEPKDVEWDIGAMEDFRGDVICPDCDDEEELNSEDDDYEDKMEGKWKCRRCGENKASSVVGDDGDCLNYCRECLGDDEEKDELCSAIDASGNALW